MIQIRYQYYGPKGKQWTNWINLDPDDSKIEILEREQKWQVKDKLLNDYRIV